ncbi:DUF6069 family protein [Ruania albidiflava]|uniref:DUF6069 family protein n=1 Tax=Ruania albidiflava TaxID=366586 RepID=UPI0023F4B6B7|nr:DUF6069 family protein [Ruania albidiflava]
MTADTARSGHPSATALRSSGWRRELSFAAGVVIVATVVNLGLYLTGRVAGATLRLDPAVGPANHQITAPDVAWKTAVPLAAGVLVLLLVRRRSIRWLTALTVLGVIVALGTGAVPPLGAHDPLTGVLLAAMHTVPGVAIALVGFALRRASTGRTRAGAAERAADLSR